MAVPGFPGVPTSLDANDGDALQQYLRQVVAVINRINRGKINVVIDVTLDANAAETKVTDVRLTVFGGAAFDPLTANAAAEIAAGTMFATPVNRRSGAWTITHANNAQADRDFRMVVLG